MYIQLDNNRCDRRNRLGFMPAKGLLMVIRLLLILLSMFFLLVACSTEPTIPPTPTASVTPAPTATATLTPSPTMTPTPVPTATPTIPSPVTVNVESDGSGDYPTLEMAIESVAAESTIILGEGIFHLEETLEIDKPLTLVGSGRDKTIVEGEGPVAVVFYAGEGLLTVRDITFRRVGDKAAVVMAILGGEVDISNCRFTNGAQSEDGMGGNGLVFLADSAGIVKDCEIDENSSVGILVLERAKPQLIGNHVHDNGGQGIYFGIEEDGGFVTRNDLSRNDRTGIVSSGTDIMVFGSFSPRINANTCSDDGVTRDSANTSGIQFVSRDRLPAASNVSENNCAIAWCTSSGGSLFSLECFRIRP